jgi:hypothetical protein
MFLTFKRLFSSQDVVLYYTQMRCLAKMCAVGLVNRVELWRSNLVSLLPPGMWGMRA